jgi:sugar phosphate isomerase/epimerase
MLAKVFILGLYLPGLLTQTTFHMKKNIARRKFVGTLLATPALAASGFFLNGSKAFSRGKMEKSTQSKLRLSLNAYSFNDLLRNGSMSLDDLLDFCAANDFDAVDLTGYYFPGYPAVPADEYIFHLKQKAFRLGLDISGTGVKNDFTYTDENKRKEDIGLVKRWIDVAAKLGAPVIRIFAGLDIPAGHSWNEVAEWMIRDLKECAGYGKSRGVLVAMQNHNDFIKTADQAEKIVTSVNSDWFGLVLDIGSYRTGDPYSQITQTAKYAFNWQLKELMFVNGAEQKTDLQRVISLIRDSGYRGYLPIETLGAGDPKIKVPVFLADVRKAMGNNEM